MKKRIVYIITSNIRALRKWRKTLAVITSSEMDYIIYTDGESFISYG